VATTSTPSLRMVVLKSIAGMQVTIKDLAASTQRLIVIFYHQESTAADTIRVHCLFVIDFLISHSYSFTIKLAAQP